MTPDNDTDRTAKLKRREIPSEAKFFDWAGQVLGCEGRHNRECILNNVRKITQHPDYAKFENEVYRGTQDYLLPDASWASIPGVEGAVPRDVCMDAIFYAKIIFYASVVDHGLNKKPLEEIYKHHCVEGIVRTGKAYRMEPEDSITVLNQYLQRIAGNFSQTFG